jgi:glycosyltransferase involved in cell wall biosynthesis
MVGVYIPTLGRPHALERVAQSVRDAARVPYTIAFVVEPDDLESHAAALKTGALVFVNEYERTYSGAFQTAYENTRDEFFVNANDDFAFQPGWDVAALTAMRDDGADVVGIHDAGASTNAILLIRRAYVIERSSVVDMPGRVFFPYEHNYCDTELRETAMARGRYTACPASVIEHVHPDFGKAEIDDTYRKGRAHAEEDRIVYESRQHLWAPS